MREAMTNNTGNQEEASKTRENQVTRILLAVSIMFLVLTMPFFFVRILYTIIDRKQNIPVYKLTLQIAEILMYTNSAINFYLYCLAGSKFRRDAINLFCRCCRGKQGTATKGSTDAPKTEQDLIGASVQSVASADGTV